MRDILLAVLASLAKQEAKRMSERVKAGMARARRAGKHLGRPTIALELENRILTALNAPGRTEGVRKIADRFGVAVNTVRRIGRPFEAVGVGAA